MQQNEPVWSVSAVNRALRETIEGAFMPFWMGGEAGSVTLHRSGHAYLQIKDDGDLNLSGICLVAGLGPENNTRRDGSFEYYISEPVGENDAKGVAPFVLCYTEILRTRG